MKNKRKLKPHCKNEGLEVINRKLTDNYIFRFFKCGLSLEKTSHLCDVSQKTVEAWDRGKPIPKHHRKMMELYSGFDISHIDDSWKGWRINGRWLVSPFGDHITMERLLRLCYVEKK